MAEADMSNFHNTILISTGVVAALPLMAVGHFLSYGWPARRQQITSRFSNESIAHYRNTFCPESDFSDIAGFKADYDKRYGRQLFVLPVLLFAVLLGIASYLGISWALTHDWSGEQDGTAKVAVFSLAGAYIWVTYDLIIRARQNDLVSSDINRSTLRLLLSLPFGFAVSAFAGVMTGTTISLSSGALAFFVGAFPTDTVLKFMRRTAGLSLKLHAEVHQDGGKLLTKITGISTPIAERFIDEGVKTPLQLAYTDPILLTIKSGMDFAFILSCCGHALVRTYFNDDQMVAVQKYGLISGFEIKTVNDALEGYDKAVADAAKAGQPKPERDPAQQRANDQLVEFAKALVLDTSSTRFILDQIAEDPYTRFIWWMWPYTEDVEDKPAPPNPELKPVVHAQPAAQVEPK